MSWMEFVLLAFVSAAVTGAAAPIVARLAVRIDAVDRPNDRKASDRAGMPLLGGFAVALGTMLGISFALQLEIGSDAGGLTYVDYAMPFRRTSIHRPLAKYRSALD